MAEEDAPDAEDRSEAATPRRIERAREQGQVALSRQASGFAALLLASLATALVLPTLGAGLLPAMRALLARAHEAGIADASAGLGWLAFTVAAPVAAAAGIGAVAATLLQTRGLVSAAPLAPKLDKVIPWAGLKRL